MPTRYLILFALVTLLVGPTSAQADQPLLELLALVPQENAYPQMNSGVLSYVDYRAVERAYPGTPHIDDAAEYAALSDDARALWQTARLRIHAGPLPFTNLVDERIADMPRLLGFEYFDMDRALQFGSDPFTGVLVESEARAFSAPRTALALAARGYDPTRLAAGLRGWAKGGDGMTDVDNIEIGDPFGGDVGLSSRVVVIGDRYVTNSFLWPIVAATAETVAGDRLSLADLPEYRSLVESMGRTGDLLQAIIVQPGALTAEGDPLPSYDLAAIADYQQGDEQVYCIVVAYNDIAAAEAAADALPGRMLAFDAGWFDLVGLTIHPPTIDQIGDVVIVSIAVRGPLDTSAGAYEPGLVFGFWARAIENGTFSPLAA